MKLHFSCFMDQFYIDYIFIIPVLAVLIVKILILIFYNNSINLLIADECIVPYHYNVSCGEKIASM